MFKDVRNGPQKSPLSHLNSLTSRAYALFNRAFQITRRLFLNCIYSSNGVPKAMYTNYTFQIIILQIFIALYYNDTHTKGF